MHGQPELETEKWCQPQPQTPEDEKAVCPAVFSMSAMSDDDSAAARACMPVRQGPELAIII